MKYNPLEWINSPFDRHISYGLSIMEGRFGVGKTTWMTWAIKLLSTKKDVFVFTNIKLKFKSPTNNIYQFADEDLEETVKVADRVSQIQNDYTKINRNKRIKFYIFLDEGAVIFNSTSLKEYESKYTYLNQLLYQLRKINAYVVVGIQRKERLLKKLRENVDDVYYFTPFLNMKIFKNIFGSYRVKEIDWNTPGFPTIILNHKSDGTPVYADRHVGWLWKPSVWKYYDDLYINRKYIHNTPMKNEYTSVYNDALNILNKNLKEKPLTKWEKFKNSIGGIIMYISIFTLGLYLLIY